MPARRGRAVPALTAVHPPLCRMVNSWASHCRLGFINGRVRARHALHAGHSEVAESTFGGSFPCLSAWSKHLAEKPHRVASHTLKRQPRGRPDS